MKHVLIVASLVLSSMVFFLPSASADCIGQSTRDNKGNETCTGYCYNQRPQDTCEMGVCSGSGCLILPSGFETEQSTSDQSVETMQDDSAATCYRIVPYTNTGLYNPLNGRPIILDYKYYYCV